MSQLDKKLSTYLKMKK